MKPAGCRPVQLATRTGTADARAWIVFPSPITRPACPLRPGCRPRGRRTPGRPGTVTRLSLSLPMVRRRSTVRFRNGAPAQGNNSNTSNGPWGPFRGPRSGHLEPRGASVCLPSAELRGLGGSLMGLLDYCAEDHRRDALDGPAHQVSWAVAVVYLGEPPFDRHGLAVRLVGHVAVRQNAGQDARCRVEFGTQDLRESAFAGFDDGAGVVCDQAAEHGVGVLGVAQVPGAVELVQVARRGA